MFDVDPFWKLIGILLGNPYRAVRAAVIDQDIIPVLVGLPEHALNAFFKIFFRIKKWGYETDAWIFWILAGFGRTVCHMVVFDFVLNKRPGATRCERQF